MTAHWLVVGSLNLDIVTEHVDDAFVSSDTGGTTWTDWRVRPGGTALNLARHFASQGEPVRLIGVVGQDDLAELVSTSLTPSTDVDVDLLKVTRAPTGLVVLMGVQGRAQSRRLVIGPATSAIDHVDFRALRDRLSLEHGASKRLVLESYMFRLRPSEDWLPFIEWCTSDGWEVHLEVVPHNLATFMRVGDFRSLIAHCASISTSLSTLERFAGIASTTGTAPVERALACAEAMRSADLISTTVRARFGEKDAEFVLLIQDDEITIQRYDSGTRSAFMSNQDWIFVCELLGTVEGELIHRGTV